MQTYVALLRGINVSGQKKIKMADLKTVLDSLELENVQTYIQSGNIVFTSELKAESYYAKILYHKILEVYGFEVPVLVIKSESLIVIIKDSPYKGEALQKSYFALLYDTPKPENIAQLLMYTFPDETYHVSQSCIYYYPENGAGRAKANNNFFEKKLKVTATSRNYRTMMKLVEMAGVVS